MNIAWPRISSPSSVTSEIPSPFRDGAAEVVDQIRDDFPVLAERGQMHSPDTSSVAFQFESNPHDASVVCEGYGSS